MRIAIIGYGRMGKEIERLAEARNWEVVYIIDKEEDWKNAGDMRKANCAVEFTTPDQAPANILRCFELGIPVVTGTTAWYDQMDMVTEKCKQKGGSLLYAPNFSKGVNILFEMNKWLANVMNSHPEYEINITEFHHVHKLDAPSGTAAKLAEDLISGLRRKESWKLGTQGNERVIPVKAIRNGEIKGTHMLNWEGPVDKITIIHEAKDRSIFAEGALDAAEWIMGRKGIYTYSEMLFS